MRGIDSNIIVYALNEDLPEHFFCKDLMKKVINGKEIVSIPSIVFMESFYALVYAYKFKETEVKKRLIALIDSRNMILMDITTATILLAFEIAEKFETGGRDSLIAASLLENKIQEIYSHDSDFDKIILLKRIDPIITTT